jgi:hypothetical protein
MGWIPVDEKKPEPFKDVLVTDGTEITVGYYSTSRPWSGWETPENYSGDVTHWQPLPELPDDKS